MPANFKLLVGLGNPTAQYEKTRHNAGFWFLDAIAARYRLGFREEPRFHGLAAKLELAGDTLLLLKPTTYMNRSGLAVGAMAKYFKVEPAQILVAHDELDLPPGVARLKRGGGHGGHNGLRDILAHLGTPDYYRLRFGIGHPGDRDAVVPYVLGAPSRAEAGLIEAAISNVADSVPELVAGNLAGLMNRLHSEPKKKA
ncbi:aminoacyl-tRNA hydrolase [Methylomagnum ishizawai]|uniref:aminoacyl-tRNA hydrolase n=1 Tax=Methylomagnum ishizawai TaxID=1760988 RepID=UPI001C32591D|nr:aminoacyl-tRNA hydrolase [Methylomagnum ishizawai]BBL76585.1 peptidyl-tRNA hydrolase [Methylomagnum ishizawai]